MNSWLGSGAAAGTATQTPPRAQSPKVGGGSGRGSMSPVAVAPADAKKNRLSLLSFRRGGSTRLTRAPSAASKAKPSALSPTAENAAPASAHQQQAAAGAPVGFEPIATPARKVNGALYGASPAGKQSLEGGGGERPTTQASDQSHGDDSLLSRGVGSVKKRFSFVGLAGGGGLGKMGRKASKSSVTGAGGIGEE